MVELCLLGMRIVDQGSGLHLTEPTRRSHCFVSTQLSRHKESQVADDNRLPPNVDQSEFSCRGHPS